MTLMSILQDCGDRDEGLPSFEASDKAAQVATRAWTFRYARHDREAVFAAQARVADRVAHWRPSCTALRHDHRNVARCSPLFSWAKRCQSEFTTATSRLLV